MRGVLGVLMMLGLATLGFGDRAEAYQLGAPEGGVPAHWAASALPVALVADGGATNMLPNLTTATTEFNDSAPLARAVYAAPTRAATDFTAANLGTAWGKDGDGTFEVALDTDGAIFTKLNLDPATTLGYTRIHQTAGVIDDAWIVINPVVGTDTQLTAALTHEFGTALGTTHSSIGLRAKDAGGPRDFEKPIMDTYLWPLFAGTKLKPDDEMALAELYPEATFPAQTATITGTVTRCGSGEPVSGANVRAVSNSLKQFTRQTGHDGNTLGTFTMHVPPGNYGVYAEQLIGDPFALAGLAAYTPIDRSFAEAGYRSVASDYCNDLMDGGAANQKLLAAGDTLTADIKVRGADLAIVIDTSQTMTVELAAIKAAVNSYVDAQTASGRPFPPTALLSFNDAVQFRGFASTSARLKMIVDAVMASGGDTCPEAGPEALVAALRQMNDGGTLLYATDADGAAAGPSAQTVLNMATEKRVRIYPMVTGSCGGARSTRSAPTPAADALGAQSAFVTGGLLGTLSGGSFALLPEGSPAAITTPPRTCCAGPSRRPSPRSRRAGSGRTPTPPSSSTAAARRSDPAARSPSAAPG